MGKSIINAVIEESIAGDGYKADYPINTLVGCSGAANFPFLTNATAPAKADVGNGFLGVQWAAASNTAYILQWTVPGEFNPAKDELDLYLSACNTVGADVATLGVAASVQRAPAAEGARYHNSPVLVGAVPAAAIDCPAGNQAVPLVVPGYCRFPFRTLELRPGDCLTFIITPADHANDAVKLYGGFIRIRRGAALHYEPARQQP